MKIDEKIKSGFVIFDGGLGTMLQSRGLPAGCLPEIWNITHPEILIEIHREYLLAGCDVITANTFGANRLKFPDRSGEYSLESIISSAVGCARSASAGREDVFVALDVGPLGKMVGALGDIEFEEAVGIFSDTIRAGDAAGADFILIETMNDIYELKAALLAARESCSLPVMATVVFDAYGRMMSGSAPGAVVALLEGLGVSALGMNCSLGPEQMKKILPELYALSSTPLLVQPNAGMPRISGGVTSYDVNPAEFARHMREMAAAGARGLGGCCGTTPEYIREMKGAIEGMAPLPVVERGLAFVSSATSALIIGKRPLIIGERINPTGKKKIKEALLAGDFAGIAGAGAEQADAGADILDVNAGLPGIDESEALSEIVTELQMITRLPLQIDTADPAAMERALRSYCGIPLINSVSGKEESLSAILPLAKKYGGVLVGLTLDEDGIPKDVSGRIRIAEKIFHAAEKEGINPKNIVIDPLAMSVSADPLAASVTLKTVAELSGRAIKTLLGVSNVSFGLPGRDIINSTYFTAALFAGLSLAIINPNSSEMQKAYRAYLALSGKDDNFAEYIAFASDAAKSAPPDSLAPPPVRTNGKDAPLKEPSCPSASLGDELHRAIVRGLGAAALKAADRLLESIDGMKVINNYIIPALAEVGESFEKQRIYLPELLMSAEAANTAFSSVKNSITCSGGTRGRIILATVKGDIHDIGKNIVKVLLESNGYEVIDLGRDVSYETILNSTAQNNIRLVGLSALMTTTLPAMEKTIKLLHESFPDCRVMVGGAVLTEEYAKTIGADYYSPDATGAVRIAGEVFGG